jgi:hypothetical protein
MNVAGLAAICAAQRAPLIRLFVLRLVSQEKPSRRRKSGSVSTNGFFVQPDRGQSRSFWHCSLFFRPDRSVPLRLRITRAAISYAWQCLAGGTSGHQCGH